MSNVQKDLAPSGTFGTEISNLSGSNTTALNTLSALVSVAPPAMVGGGHNFPHLSQSFYRPFPAGSVGMFNQQVLQPNLAMAPSSLGQAAYQNIPPQLLNNRALGLQMLTHPQMIPGRPGLSLQNPFLASGMLRTSQTDPSLGQNTSFVHDASRNVSNPSLNAAVVPAEPKEKTKSVPNHDQSRLTSVNKRSLPQTNAGRKKARRNGRRCNVPGCTKLARSTTYQCAAHGGGKRCQYKSEDGQACKKSARSTTRFCIAHGGGKRCQHGKCDKSAQGATRFCIAHGGGRRCTFKGCNKSARGKKGFCKAHGGGKRCERDGCDKLVTSKVDFCRKHRPQRICAENSCDISLAVDRRSNFCARHDNIKTNQEISLKEERKKKTQVKVLDPEIVPLSQQNTYLVSESGSEKQSDDSKC